MNKLTKIFKKILKKKSLKDTFGYQLNTVKNKDGLP